MKAMILAAGLGTRLRPLTNDRPKALVEIDGRTLLEITLCRLREFGIRKVIVNVHHFAEKMVEYLRAHDNFGMRIEVSREDVLLDTGGGLKKAAWFFQEAVGGKAETDDAFLLHNVDVLSNINFEEIVSFHLEHGALATLAVQRRETSRSLLFDSHLQLCGRRRRGEEVGEVVRSADQLEPLGFTGIHVISNRMLRMMRETGVFSIVDTYLRLASEGERISGFRADDYYWRDLGSPENLQSAAEDVRRRVIGACS